MARSISKDTRRELVQAIAGRYRIATRIERGQILDEFVKLTNYHRKHAVRLLGGEGPPAGKGGAALKPEDLRRSGSGSSRGDLGGGRPDL